uniref:EOG090X07KM n=1 Tax=Lynceus sp. MCZ IZ 141354 TaxID=1930659 RepID=A0A9N6WST8_9CRUS|nr:EOG090X07KM [Lynceus sp. MCZ IZ 141354]
MDTDETDSGPVLPLGSVEAPSKATSESVTLSSSPLTSKFYFIYNSLVTVTLLPLTIIIASIQLFSFLYKYAFSRKSLEGKIVLLTGASSGLGEALAKALYQEGCRLILASRNTRALEKCRLKLLTLRRENVYPPTILNLDLSKIHELPQKAQQALSIYGNIDILINNAGISYRGEIINTQIDVDMELMNVNYFGQVNLTKHILPSMIENNNGNIVMIGSVQGRIGIPFRSAYAASKHALQAFSDCLRAEVKSYGINVTVINPGYIRTNLSLNAVTGDGSRYGILDATTASGMDPDVAATKIIQAIKSNKKELLLCPLQPRVALHLRNCCPSSYHCLMAWRAKKEKQKNL